MQESLNQALAQRKTREAGQAHQGQEAAWVAACLRGDNLAFNRLVLKWEKPVYNLALRMLQDQDEAADATQEVFCSAYRSIGSFRREARFSTWLYRIAVNQCISRLRRRPPGIHLSMDDQSEGAPLKGWTPSRDSHEEEYLLEEERKRVRHALGFLPEDQRALVELKFFQDLTFEEIAAIVNEPLSTIKSRLYAGLSLLKIKLGSQSQIA